MQKVNYWNNLVNGSGGPDGADFVNRDTALGRTGTFIPAGWSNMIQDELSNLVTSAGLALDGADATQVTDAVKYWAIQTNSVVLLGSQNMIFSGAGSTTFSVEPESYIEVNGIYTNVTSAISNDLTTINDIYDAIGVDISSITEIQNKHLYVLFDSSGNLKLQIIPDSEMESATNSTLYNPTLILDRYATTPTIWDATKKGYYKTIQLVNYRIAGHIFVNGSNAIDYYYELSQRWNYRGFEYLRAGDLFIENHYKREHPQCFELDGSTVANLDTDYPALYNVILSTTLPNLEDRFIRSILSGSARSIRDLQEDAFQGWQLGATNGANTYYSAGQTDDTTNAPESSANNTAIRNNTGFQGNSYMFTAKNDGTNGTPRTADETRPKNYSVLIQGVKG